MILWVVTLLFTPCVDFACPCTIFSMLVYSFCKSLTRSHVLRKNPQTRPYLTCGLYLVLLCMSLASAGYGKAKSGTCASAFLVHRVRPIQHVSVWLKRKHVTCLTPNPYTTTRSSSWATKVRHVQLSGARDDRVVCNTCISPNGGHGAQKPAGKSSHGDQVTCRP